MILKEKKIRVGITAHDAGAANIIYSLIKEFDHHKYFFHIDGPARNIFSNKKKFINSTPKDLLTNCDILISGTGWQSKHEHDVRKLFKDNNKFVVSVIDHWVNYKERFKHDKKSLFTDELWVTDQKAYLKAKKDFGSIKVKKIENYYLRDVLRNIKKIDKNNGKSILYFSEPIRNHKDKLREFRYIDFLKLAVEHYGLSNLDIVFRTHPTESKEKYQDYLSTKLDNFMFDSEKNIESSIANSAYIFGIQSMALYLSASYGKTTFSLLLPDDGALALPSENIVQLRKDKDLIKKMSNSFNTI